MKTYYTWILFFSKYAIPKVLEATENSIERHCFDWLFIVHRYSRKYLMIFGILAWTACTLASSFMQDYTSFCVMRSLIGFGEAGFRFAFYRTLLLGAYWFGSSALILRWRLINSDWNNISGEPANLAKKVYFAWYTQGRDIKILEKCAQHWLLFKVSKVS